MATQENPVITMYGANISPFARKTIFALRKKSLDFELVFTAPGTKTPEYLQISPLGKIPAVTIGDLALCDSTVICEYLDDAYPANPLHPAEAEVKAKARWIEEVGDSKVAEAFAGLFREKLVNPILFKTPTDENKVRKLTEKLIPSILVYLESIIPESGYLFGDEIMLADVSIVTHIINAGYAGYSIDADKWPKTAAFVERVKQNAIIAQMLVEEADTLAMLNG